MGGIVGNKYYNNPQVGQAFQNLAQMYAPPSAQDMSALAQANARRQEATRLQQLFESGATPSESAALAGVQGYGQTPQGYNYGVDTAAATARHGHDQNLAGTQYTADQNLTGDMYAADQTRQGDMFNTLFGALGEGEVRPAVPESEAALFGLGGAIGGAAGVPSRPSEDEVRGANLQSQMDTMTPDQLLGLALGDETVKVQGDNGPVFANPGVAAATGAPAYVDKGSEAAPELLNWQSPDGGNGTAVFDPVRGTWLDTQTQQPIPAGSTTFKAQAQGGREDITKSNMTDYNRVQQTVTTSNALIDQLEGLIQSQAGAAGLPGTLRSMGQDFAQVGRELAGAFGDDMDGIVTEEMLAGLSADGGQYNPVYQQIRTGMLQLAYLNAQRDNPRGEVSRFALERQIEALGQGLLSNDQSILAALSMSREANDRSLQGADALVGRGPAPQPPAPPTPPAPQSAPGPAVGAVDGGYRFMGGDPSDQANWEPVN